LPPWCLKQQRHVGFTLDSMLVELSYMAGPALAVASMTTLGSGATMMIIGGSLTIAGLALIMLNPPIRSTAEEVEHRERAGSTPRRQWFTPAFATLLGAAMAAMFILTATELALVATMTHAHQTAWTGLAIAIWCAYSLVGGFLYGGLRRGFPPHPHRRHGSADCACGLGERRLALATPRPPSVRHACGAGAGLHHGHDQ
jgi:hypothetical protein